MKRRSQPFGNRLKQVIGRLFGRFRPQYLLRRGLRERAELERLARGLFPPRLVGRLFRHRRIRLRGTPARWIIRTEGRMDAALLFCLLPSVGTPTVRRTADRLVTSVRLDGKSAFTLTEYRSSPTLGRMRAEGRERLAARAILRTGRTTREVATFYAVGPPW